MKINVRKMYRLQWRMLDQVDRFPSWIVYSGLIVLFLVELCLNLM